MSNMAMADWQRAPPRVRGDRLAQLVLRKPRLIGAGLLLGIGLAGLVMAAASGAPPAPSIAPPMVRPMVSWTEIIKPIGIFSLDAPALAAAAAAYRARRNRLTTAREDILSFGTLGRGDLSLRLSILRGTDGQAKAPFFAALARQAADAGLALTRIALPDLLATRFGRFEIADVTLDAAPAGCSGFRLALAQPALTITGLACSGRAGPIDRARLACLIDRLDLVSGAADAPLVAFFAAAELRRRSECETSTISLGGQAQARSEDRPATARKIVRRH